MLLPKPAASRYCVCIHYSARTINPDLGVSGVGNLSKEATTSSLKYLGLQGTRAFLFRPVLMAPLTNFVGV